MTLTPNAAGVTATTNNAVDVSVGIGSMSLSPLATTIGSNVIVQPGVGSMSLSPQSTVVDFTPIQGNITVDVSTGSMTLTPNNASLGLGSQSWTERVSAATGGGFISNFNTSVDALFSLDPVPNGNNAANAFVKKSGGFSYEIPINPSDGTLSGEKNFYLWTDEHALAPGEDIYLQFRQYIPAYMMDYVWEGTRSGGVSQGWKQNIMSHVHASIPGGQGSNTSSELVLQERIQSSFPSGYNQDGNVSAFHWADHSFMDSGCTTTDRQYQPAIDRGAQTGTPVATDPADQITRGQTCRDNAARYGPFHSYVNDGWGERGRADPLSGGVPFHKYPGKGNWITMYQHIKIGAGGQTAGGNTWECWVAHDGDPYTLLFSRSDVDLGSVPILGNWLIAYRSDGLGNASRRAISTFYDEVIVSSSPIAVPSEPTTALKTLADSLSPGQWGQLTGISGLDATNFAWGGFQALDYGSKAMFDEITGKLHLLHGGHQVAVHHIVYDETTNAFTTINTNVPNPGSGHGYDCGAIDVDRRKLFWRGYNSDTIDIYDLDTDTWSSSPSFSGQWQVASSLTYNEHLGVCQFWDERQGLVNYDPQDNTLTTMVPIAQTDTIGAGALHVASDYSPKQRKTVFGGGDSSTGMGSVDVNSSFSLESAAPSAYGPTRARMTHDPVSGDFMMMNASNLYRKDPITGTWSVESNLSGGPDFSENAMTSSWDLVSAPVYKYGVTIWVKTNDTGTSGEVWLYKAS